MKEIVLRAGRERSVERRHPWIFSGAVDSVPDGLAAGEVVRIVSAAGAVLGCGWYSPSSKISVRMLKFASDEIEIEPFIHERVQAAAMRRQALLAGGGTNAVRLVNAEADGLPGVVADYYAGFVVCQLTSAGAERWKNEIVDALLKSAPSCRGVGERIDNDSRAREGLQTADDGYRQLAGEEPPEMIEITEGPCRFLVDVRKGHKTGFYLDQRDARLTVSAFAKDGEVLNCFSYTGGFGLFARAAGAKRVTQVDISAEAIAVAKRNEALTPSAGTEMEYVVEDVFRYLRECRDAGRTFDLIVLDPPKFAATRNQLFQAARGYKDINLLAMKLLKKGGVLATFSCSGAMVTASFDAVLAEAAQDARRDFQILARTRAAADHPEAIAFPEGSYLKGVVLHAL